MNSRFNTGPAPLRTPTEPERSARHSAEGQEPLISAESSVIICEKNLNNNFGSRTAKQHDGLKRVYPRLPGGASQGLIRRAAKHRPPAAEEDHVREQLPDLWTRLVNGHNQGNLPRNKK